jgi:predicted DNA-binding protein (MmcQ/YjbR family)
VVTLEKMREIALSFPDTIELPHFENISFRVKKKIFATYDSINHRSCIKLSSSDQDIFSLSNKTVIYPVDNKWGTQGWTYIEMNSIGIKLFKAAMKNAYRKVANLDSRI